MLKLVAKYWRKPNGRWAGRITNRGYSHIVVEDGEDTETVRVILKIMCSEEIPAMHNNIRQRWEISEEHIFKDIDSQDI